MLALKEKDQNVSLIKTISTKFILFKCIVPAKTWFNNLFKLTIIYLLDQLSKALTKLMSVINDCFLYEMNY